MQGCKNPDCVVDTRLGDRWPMGGNSRRAVPKSIKVSSNQPHKADRVHRRARLSWYNKTVKNIARGFRGGEGVVGRVKGGGGGEGGF